MKAITLALAVGCGVTVANLYYAQPLLPEISRALGVTEGTASLAVTATQIGYAVGVALLVPLGDLLENRALTSRILIGTFLALVATALAPGFSVLLTAAVLVGVTSVAAQVLVPFAAQLAPEASRGRLVGRVVGRVMTGLLLGILLARTAASFVAAAFGWRAIYWVSAALVVGLWWVLRRVMPARRPPPGPRYRTLLASMITLVRTEPVLRRRALAQCAMFGAFSMFWTAISFELASRHGFSQAQIGLFALVGAAGAAAAPIAGRLGDRGRSRPGRVLAALLGTLALLLAALGSRSVVLLAAGGVLLDFAVQGHQVLGQRDIYSLRADARSRINTVYITVMFAGGALASAAAGGLHHLWGWPGTALVAAALPLIALVADALPARTSSAAPAH